MRAGSRSQGTERDSEIGEVRGASAAMKLDMCSAGRWMEDMAARFRGQGCLWADWESGGRLRRRMATEWGFGFKKMAA